MQVRLSRSHAAHAPGSERRPFMHGRIAHKIRLVVAILATTALLASLAAITGMEHRGAHPPARPDAGEPALAYEGFPRIDWTTWESINPDIVGWITVPGADIDLPIVQAHADDPQFYLAHDVYGNVNFTGCPYLDWECEGLGGLMKCPNSVVFAHNMGWNADMFANLARYADAAYARANREVLIQTPTEHIRLHVQAADVIPGWEDTKRIDFTDGDDFRMWMDERFSCADVELPHDFRNDTTLLTLCTCSYNYWSNERTLVYCTPVG